ncbi:hypothetical protein MIAR_07210 [Microbacterium arabinogalactanolyticum]|uniref:Uncharacterized protein n=2 Tax=Microbacterium arabinogalactanolyticum TaxID=69365 RepID=A0ABQ5NF99_9MICO|nr:hypothetical protein MIAR_07210 [Microbacterium arabinogalactanolyticum]
MSKAESRPGPNVLLSLADNPDSTSVCSSWIGPILALGTRLARKVDDFNGRQLIVAISVPSREYAAALIGSGWNLGRPPAQVTTDPFTVLRAALPLGNYRAVNANHVISGRFQGLSGKVVRDKLRVDVTLAGHWVVDMLEAVAATGKDDPAERMPRPHIGSIGRMTGVDRNWAQRLVAPAADLAIVGTKSWISDDLEAVLARGDDPDGDSLATLLLPRTEKSATWFSRIYSSSGFADQLPLPDDVILTILDGQGAIRYLNDVLSPIVVCVFDRSVADESAAEQVVQLRNSRGEPIALSTQLGWVPPAGVEALGFTVTL